MKNDGAVKLPSERIIEDAKEICDRMEIKPFTDSQLVVIGLIIGHQVDMITTQVESLGRKVDQLKPRPTPQNKDLK